MNKLTERETAWLAGLLEADGHSPTRYRIYAKLEMIDEDTVKQAYTLAGVGFMRSQDRASTKGKQWQTTFVWTVQAKQDVLELLEMIEPYIVASRRHAQFARMRA